MSARDTNGDSVRPTVVTAWQLIGAAISVMAAFGLALWTVITDQNRANEAILNELHTNYVSKTQHDDLANRLTREVARVDDLAKEVMPRNEFNRWNASHEQIEESIRKAVDALQKDTINRREYDGLIIERARQIESNRRSIEELNKLLHSDKRSSEQK